MSKNRKKLVDEKPDQRVSRRKEDDRYITECINQGLCRSSRWLQYGKALNMESTVISEVKCW